MLLNSVPPVKETYPEWNQSAGTNRRRHHERPQLQIYQMTEMKKTNQVIREKRRLKRLQNEQYKNIDEAL